MSEESKDKKFIRGELKQIPVGVLKEINEHFDTVSIDLESEVTENTKSYKLKYIDVDEELITSPVMDPETFETHDVTGHSATCYMARIDILENECIIRRVLSIGNVLVPHKEDGE